LRPAASAESPFRVTAEPTQGSSRGVAALILLPSGAYGWQMDAARTEIEREWNENPSFRCVAPPAWRRNAAAPDRLS
jgi:hypothetical protein